MNVYDWLWIAWAVAFICIELPAILNNQEGDTLSEKVWAIASIKTKGGHWRIRRLILLSGLAWLCLHFLTGGQF